jgi:hypothetical protein
MDNIIQGIQYIKSYFCYNLYNLYNSFFKCEEDGLEDNELDKWLLGFVFE